MATLISSRMSGKPRREPRRAPHGQPSILDTTSGRQLRQARAPACPTTPAGAHPREPSGGRGSFRRPLEDSMCCVDYLRRPNLRAMAAKPTSPQLPEHDTSSGSEPSSDRGYIQTFSTASRVPNIDGQRKPLKCFVKTKILQTNSPMAHQKRQEFQHPSNVFETLYL